MIPFVLLVFAPAASAAPRVVVLDLRDTVQPASQRYLERGLRSAADAGAALVVIELDTPGGLLESLRSMTSAILRSPVPVAVYVTPAGARAASAGFFLLIAGDVAAMAPGTHTGAAHPVGIGQKDDDTSMAKATEDATALARSLAAGRHRSVAWAEKVVRESAAYTADEARGRGLIDLIAIDRNALLRALDGASIWRFDGSTHTLHLAGAEIASLDRTLAERVLTVIASPQIAYLLLTLGAICLLIELTSPGLVVPGIVGALALLMGLYGLSLVPVSLVGALLMAVGFGLLVAEVFVTSYGLLAIAGIVGFVFGSLMLVDTSIPELQIGLELVVPTAVVLAGLTTVALVRAVRAQRLRPQTGIEAMIGERGQLVAGITADHDGKVFVHGEYWAATAAQPLPEGATVRVEAVDGLRLRVALVAPRGESV
jgi:membrane-bound serine protease (ClpP class)